MKKKKGKEKKENPNPENHPIFSFLLPSSLRGLVFRPGPRLPSLPLRPKPHGPPPTAAQRPAQPAHAFPSVDTGPRLPARQRPSGHARASALQPTQRPHTPVTPRPTRRRPISRVGTLSSPPGPPVGAVQSPRASPLPLSDRATPLVSRLHPSPESARSPDRRVSLTAMAHLAAPSSSP